MNKNIREEFKSFSTSSFFDVGAIFREYDHISVVIHSHERPILEAYKGDVSAVGGDMRHSIEGLIEKHQLPLLEEECK